MNLVLEQGRDGWKLLNEHYSKKAPIVSIRVIAAVIEREANSSCGAAPRTIRSITVPTFAVQIETGASVGA